GCPSCNYKGYAGRTGIFEVLPITKNMQKLIAENAGISELTKLARSEGMKSIMESGMKKVRSGVTSLEEVLKVANEME
ncbi:MAG: type IV-A pilus assembly ATPase PilB, partial [Acholeplasmataceae bacterium]|nr:type IV-A pilus assembly ATPase PilB [Acholeplasmataceae bacterium]